MIDESNGYENIAEIYIKGRGRAINGIGASTAWHPRYKNIARSRLVSLRSRCFSQNGSSI